MLLFGRPSIEKLARRRDMDGLIGALDSGGYGRKAWEYRDAAGKALLEIAHPGAVAVLIAALERHNERLPPEWSPGMPRQELNQRNKHYSTVQWLLRGLGRTGSPRALKPLLQALKDPDGRVRRAAADALGDVGDPKAVHPLTEALTREPDLPLAPFIAALARIGGETAAACLLEYLEQENAGYHRDEVEHALAEMGSAAVPSLVRGLGSRRFRVRQAAVEVLQKLAWKPRGLAETVLFSLARRPAEDLVSLGEPVVGILSQVLLERVAWGEGEALPILNALGRIGGEEATDLLIQFAESDQCSKDSSLPSAVIEALGDTRSRKAVDVLLAILHSMLSASDWEGAGRWPEPRVARECFSATWPSEETLAAVRPVWQRLRWGRPESRGKPWALRERSQNIEAAVEALARIGHKTCAEPIVRWLLAPRPGIHVCGSEERSRYINLFEDYTDIILDCLRLPRAIQSERILNADPNDPGWERYYRYDLVRLANAVNELARIETPTSTNLLRLLAERPDVCVVTVERQVWGDLPTDQFGPAWEEAPLNLEPVREAAAQELRRRGDPPFDSRAFLDEGAWKL